MIRAFMTVVIVALIVSGALLQGGYLLMALAVVLAYLMGRCDEWDAQRARRGGAVGGWDA